MAEIELTNEQIEKIVQRLLERLPLAQPAPPVQPIWVVPTTPTYPPYWRPWNEVWCGTNTLDAPKFTGVTT